MHFFHIHDGDISSFIHFPLVLHICISKLGSALVQIMACLLFCAGLLSNPMLGYCQLDPHEQTPLKFYQNRKLFIHENASENVVCEMAAVLSSKSVIWPSLNQCTINPLLLTSHLNSGWSISAEFSFNLFNVFGDYFEIISTVEFVPKGPISNMPALVEIMAWHQSGNKLLSEPMVA